MQCLTRDCGDVKSNLVSAEILEGCPLRVMSLKWILIGRYHMLGPVSQGEGNAAFRGLRVLHSPMNMKLDILRCRSMP